jgi:hypothetical protein
MTDTYCYLHLRGRGRDNADLKSLLAELAGAWRRQTITLWGVWEGLFGVASNELILIAAGGGERPEADFTGLLSGQPLEILEVRLLHPTVRPDGTAPCVTPGLYVFRFFDVDTVDMDEVARLSRQAWETFENSDAYQSEPQGLFRPANRSAERGRMLLVTWYDGLESWQTSRRPAPEARENFQRRRALTHGTVAFATRLVTPFD